MKMPFGFSIVLGYVLEGLRGEVQHLEVEIHVRTVEDAGTTDSPKMVGRGRNAHVDPLTVDLLVMRPSWGRRVSAMLREDITLMREMIACFRCCGGGAIS